MQASAQNVTATHNSMLDRPSQTFACSLPAIGFPTYYVPYAAFHCHTSVTATMMGMLHATAALPTKHSNDKACSQWHCTMLQSGLDRNVLAAADRAASVQLSPGS